jgi:hypothetical protein
VHLDVDDDEFLRRVAGGLEPRDHAGNVRLARTMHQRHGYALGLRRTQEAIRRRAEHTGGTWDAALTRRWYDALAAGAAAGSGSFLEVRDMHGRRDVA